MLPYGVERSTEAFHLREIRWRTSADALSRFKGRTPYNHASVLPMQR